MYVRLSLVCVNFVWIALSNLQSAQGSGLFDLRFEMFNCRRIYKVCNVYMGHTRLSPLSDMTWRSIQYPRIWEEDGERKKFFFLRFIHFTLSSKYNSISFIILLNISFRFSSVKIHSLSRETNLVPSSGF